ncbi:MAG: NUDIX domain-containing protein [Chloroflexota bacterium]
MTRGQRTRVAAYALVTDDAGRVLLCRIAPSVAPGEIWTLPGGGLEFGEPPRIAVLRELAEEAGYKGEIIELADVADRVLADTGRNGRLHAIRIVYRVRVVGGELRDEVDGSTDTCRWVSRAEALRLNLGSLARHALTLLDTPPASGRDDRIDLADASTGA